MQTELPAGIVLSPAIMNSSLIHKTAAGNLSLTDAQHAGLSAGIADGNSVLLVAPTSSGKTEVGLIGMAAWLSGGDRLSRRAVYLVSHRALARQKFNELRTSDFLQICALENPDLVMSNGDLTIDAGGAIPDDPLTARLLIATYEKFLALLSATGLREDMSHYCVVADEFQLIGDSARGRDVELLFTSIRRAGYGQFIGLSAVLNPRDLGILAEWIGARQVSVETREIPLEFEFRTRDDTAVWRTDGAEEPAIETVAEARNVIDVLTELEADRERNFPVAVFCMTKPRVEELCRQWGGVRGVADGAVPLQPDMFEEETALAGALAVYMPHGFGMHTADLIEGERALVEQALDSDQLAVVFATTTLAQGLNYSFKTVIFDKWARWDRGRRVEVPLTIGEFHNIAGRAGRLGKMNGHHGRVLFFASNRAEAAAGGRYLTKEIDPRIAGQIRPENLEQVVLQILSSGLASTADDLLDFIAQSLSGFVARLAGRNQDEAWKAAIDQSLANLSRWGFIQ